MPRYLLTQHRICGSRSGDSPPSERHLYGLAPALEVRNQLFRIVVVGQGLNCCVAMFQPDRRPNKLGSRLMSAKIGVEFLGSTYLRGDDDLKRIVDCVVYGARRINASRGVQGNGGA